MDKIIIADVTFIVTTTEDKERSFTAFKAYGNKIHLFNKYLFFQAMKIKEEKATMM